MNAIIYCRVSTKEQSEQGHSLEGQEKECRKFAQAEDYEVDKIFVERGESAKTTDRTQLQKMIKYAVENKEEITALIIWKYDRFARNLSDQTELVKAFSNCGIKVLSVTENNEENSIGKLMRNILGSFAQYENDVKSERTINGMKQAILQGRWCWRPHIGYKHERGLDGKPILVPSEDAPFIKEAFALFETGLYKQIDIVKELKKKGFLKLDEKHLNSVLRNHI
jgi:DNA invertase Pin-like site-specific DNA recombinase